MFAVAQAVFEFGCARVCSSLSAHTSCWRASVFESHTRFRLVRCFSCISQTCADAQLMCVFTCRRFYRSSFLSVFLFVTSCLGNVKFLLILCFIVCLTVDDLRAHKHLLTEQQKIGVDLFEVSDCEESLRLDFLKSVLFFVRLGISNGIFIRCCCRFLAGFRAAYSARRDGAARQESARRRDRFLQQVRSLTVLLLMISARDLLLLFA